MFSFPAGTKMFQFPAFAHHYDVVDIKSTGLPHSEISGSRVICTSPELVAACHVLLRLREPRHPPVALFFFFLSMNARTSLLSYSDLKVVLKILFYISGILLEVSAAFCFQ